MSCAEESRRRRRFPLETRAARTPDAPALIWRAGAFEAPGDPIRGCGAKGGGSTVDVRAISFQKLESISHRAARALLRRGIVPGERVGMLATPGPFCLVLLLGLLRAGCVAVVLSTREPEAALAGLLARAGCRRLIAGTGQPPPRAGIELVDATDIAFLGAAQGPDDPPCPPGEEGGGVRTSPPSPGGTASCLPPFDAGSDATIVFTSGSAGAPKAVLHTFDNHRASAAGVNRSLALRPGDRWLLSLPLWHVGGLAIVFRCLLAGAAVAIASKDEPLTDAIANLGATHLSLVATQLHRLLADPAGRAALRATKATLLGGGPLPFPLIEEAALAGAPVVCSYGCTEMASAATATRPRGPVEALGTAGRALAFREIAIATDGEILARGRSLMKGYVDGGAVDPARDAAGWFHTGDLGSLDLERRLVVAGRRDAMFVSGGENIHPEQIERELMRYPGVLEATVVPLPDPQFGARPAAFVRTTDGSLPDAASIGRFLRETLPGFKVPVRYLPWPDLAQGLKPDRLALAARARDAAGCRP